MKSPHSSRERWQSSAAPVVNNKWTLSAPPCRRPPRHAFSQGCPGPAPEPSQPPMCHGRPEVRDAPGHGFTEPNVPDGRGGEASGDVQRRAECQSCAELAAGTCKVLLQGERPGRSRCSACQAAETFQAAGAECWLTFWRTSANSCQCQVVTSCVLSAGRLGLGIRAVVLQITGGC